MVDALLAHEADNLDDLDATGRVTSHCTDVAQLVEEAIDVGRRDLVAQRKHARADEARAIEKPTFSVGHAG